MTSFLAALKRIEGIEANHVLCVLDRTAGHKEFTWEPDDEAAVAVAEREFQHARERGMTAFEFNASMDGTTTKSFNPEAEAIIMASPLSGG